MAEDESGEEPDWKAWKASWYAGEKVPSQCDGRWHEERDENGWQTSWWSSCYSKGMADPSRPRPTTSPRLEHSATRQAAPNPKVFVPSSFKRQKLEGQSSSSDEVFAAQPKHPPEKFPVFAPSELAENDIVISSTQEADEHESTAEYLARTFGRDRKHRKAILKEHHIYHGEGEDFALVPKRLVPKLIGKNAQQIQAIKNKSGARVVDARDQSRDPVRVRIIGSSESIAKAKQMINELVEETQNAFASARFVDIPKRRVPQLIGDKGVRIKQLQISLDVKIDIPDTSTDPCKLYIRGCPEKVEKALVALLGLASLTEAAPVATEPDEFIQRLAMPEDAMGVILGKDGLRIRGLQARSGARIDVEKKEGKCWLRASGQPTHVEEAIELILTLLAKELPSATDKIELF